ncbi:MAG: LegC family aminotransferase [Fimbriimonadaceae bacterium]
MLDNRDFIPLSIPHLAGREWEYVKDCLDTGWVSSVGSYVNKFEEEFAKVVSTNYAVACSNGTTALQVALQCCGVQPGDQVLVSDLTFIASANAISHLGATPIFIDAEPRYWQMDPAEVADYLGNECTFTKGETFHKASGQRVKAVMPVHILGIPVDLNPILELAQEYNLAVVEDATESLGATYHHHCVGSIGDMAAFSFNGNKLITTGGGGMITTNNPELAKRAKHLTTTAKIDPVEFIHDEIGYNYRLVNLLAAVGVAQLEQLPTFLAKKKEIASWYQELLKDNHDIHLMTEPDYGKSANWLYTVKFPHRSWRSIQKTLEDNQIQTRPLWQCLHQSPAYKHLTQKECPIATHLQNECLSLPCSISLTQDQAERVATQLQIALKQVE